MILVSHIILSSASLLFAVFSVLFSSKAKIIFTKMTATGSILTGAWMIIFDYANVSKMCLQGALFLLLIYILLRIANNKLLVLNSK